MQRQLVHGKKTARNVEWVMYGWVVQQNGEARQPCEFQNEMENKPLKDYLNITE